MILCSVLRKCQNIAKYSGTVRNESTYLDELVDACEEHVHMLHAGTVHPL